MVISHTTVGLERPVFNVPVWRSEQGLQGASEGMAVMVR